MTTICIGTQCYNIPESLAVALAEAHREFLSKFEAVKFKRESHSINIHVAIDNAYNNFCNLISIIKHNYAPFTIAVYTDI